MRYAVALTCLILGWLCVITGCIVYLTVYREATEYRDSYLTTTCHVVEFSTQLLVPVATAGHGSITTRDFPQCQWKDVTLFLCRRDDPNNNFANCVNENIRLFTRPEGYECFVQMNCHPDLPLTALPDTTWELYFCIFFFMLGVILLLIGNYGLRRPSSPP